MWFLTGLLFSGIHKFKPKWNGCLFWTSEEDRNKIQDGDEDVQDEVWDGDEDVCSRKFLVRPRTTTAFTLSRRLGLTLVTNDIGNNLLILITVLTIVVTNLCHQ